MAQLTPICEQPFAQLTQISGGRLAQHTPMCRQPLAQLTQNSGDPLARLTHIFTSEVGARVPRRTAPKPLDLVTFSSTLPPEPSPRPPPAKTLQNGRLGGPFFKTLELEGPAGGPKREPQSGPTCIPEAPQKGTPGRDPSNWPGRAARPNQARGDAKFDYSCGVSTSRMARPKSP